MNKKIVYSVFESISEKFPNNIAVEQVNRRITYDALNKNANKIAYALRENGVGKDVIVGIFLPASIDYITSMLGVLKSGAVFMPLDIEFPEKRLEYIFKKTSPKIIITNREHEQNVLKRLASLNITYPVETIPVSDQVSEKTCPDINPPLVSDPDDSCYIIYTSGSTGEPKAILGQHKGLSHFIHWEIQEFGLNEKTKVSLFAPTTFDVSFRDIFVPLLSGGTLCIPNKDIRTNVSHLVKWIEDSALSLIHCVPSLFRLILKEIENKNANVKTEALPNLKYILLAGEALYGNDVIRWKEQVGNRIELVNLYGPSETTLAKIYHRINELPVEKNKIIPLGKPISNAAVLILKDNALCRVGEIGEIFIKTPFRSKGYYNSPALTAENFIRNPLTNELDDIIYKTGDLGRYLSDRTIEFVGRLDGQVKINGIRIELNEIESALFAYDFIERPLVVAYKTQDHEVRLICYYTEKKPVEISQIRTWLQQYLPDYMIPSFFVRLDEFPLNLNGKIDKKSLPKPEDIIYAKIKYEEPANETETLLAKLWAEVLDLEKVGVNNPFFEIGGNSLSAIRIISKIYKTFEKEISIQNFFANATVRQLANFILDVDKLGYSEIKPVETQDYYPVSHAQRRLWIIDRLEKNPVNYNLPGACLLDGKIDVNAFRKAFDSLIERHESLRTVFITADGQPKQKILAKIGFALEETDLSEQPDNKTLARILIEKDSLTPFDLETGPLLKAKLICLSPDCHILFVNMHHIVSDALSLDIVTNEVMAFYKAYKNNETLVLPHLKIQYKDYAAWQNALLESDKITRLRAYWRDKLSGELPVLNLPTDYQRPKIQTFRGSTIRFVLKAKSELQKIAETNNASLFMVVISLVKTLFHRYTSQEDIIIGTPIAGRSHPDLENQIGFYVNMLPLRDTIRSEDRFDDILRKVKQTCIEAYDNQMYPFDRLVDELALARDMSRSPVFDVMVVMHNETKSSRMSFDNVKVSEFDFGLFTSKYDLTFTVTETGDSLDILLEYNTDLFKQDRILRMKDHMEELTKNIISDPNHSISRINIIPEWERHKILVEFNDTTTEYPKDKTIAEVFEQKAKQVPNNPAVMYEGTGLSYRELNACANQLAHMLREKFGVSLEERVGILLDKSERMVISILGVLKSGGACMSIDPMYPIERIKYMIEDAQCRVVISEGKYITDIMSLCSDVRVIDVSQFGTSHPEFDIDTPDLQPLGNGRSLAYVIYTSGSTGKPKGSLIEQRTALRLVINTNYIDIRESDRILQTVSFSFDVSVFEIWGALLNGACVYLIPDRAIVEADKMKHYVSHYKITIMWLTTSLFNELSDAELGIFNGLGTLLVGGEKLSPHHINKVKRAHPNLKVINGYGPTENGTFTTCHLVDEFYERDIPVGKPLSNTQVFILDRNDEIVPIGISGELCTSGDGLARCYLNRPELNKERFVPHPYKQGENMYRIGDTARWMPDGCIECFGRNDDQVKIRGYRIELGEIQNRLLQHPAIRQAVVLERLNKSSQTKELTAYFVCQEGIETPPDISELRHFMGEFLPNYMIPAYFVHMAFFVLNANGKVDRHLLPSPEEAAMGINTKIVQPRDEIESKLLDIWKLILGKENIGINDNYFAIGGDSIKAIQIVARLQEDNLKIEVRDIFQEPTISELAKKVVKTERKIDQSTVTGIIPLTSVQCWFFDNYKRARNHFNQAEMLYSKERFQGQALRRAIEKIQEHHDALRMKFRIEDSKFKIEDSKIIQENCGLDYPLGFETIDLTDEKDANLRLKSYADQVQASIDLTIGPLMKVVLFRMKDGDRLLIVLHHLVVDGLSWRILAEDIGLAYAQCLANEPLRLPMKTHSFKHWSEQLQRYAESDELSKEKAYWKTIESCKIEPLPKDFDSPETDASIEDTETIEISLSEQETETLLTKVNHAYNTQINDILLTALARSMETWHGGKQTLINMEGHGREQFTTDTKSEIQNIDITRTVGWFTGMYPVILEIPNTDDLGYQIKYVKESLRKIPNKGMGYNILKYLSEKNKAKSFNIKAPVSFNYMGQFENINDTFELAAESSGINVSPKSEFLYDIDLNSIVIRGRLQLAITYNRKFYKPETIENLGKNFKQELVKIVNHCEAVQDTEITPSDIDYEGLNIEELDKVLETL